MPESVTDFSKRIKIKYPEYADIDDIELAKRVVDKYPEYKDKVSFDAPAPVVARPAATVPEPVGLKPPKMAEFTPEQISKVQEPTAANLTKAATSKLTTPETMQAFARGLTHGSLGLAESVGTGLQYVGAVDLGDKVEKYWGEKAKAFEANPNIQGSIVKNPALLKDPSWWTYNLAEMAPSFAAAMVPGVAAGKYLSIGGKALKFAPDTIKWLAKIGTPLVAGAAGGALEGANTYKVARDMGVKGGLSKDEAHAQARLAASEMTAASAALNAISFGKMLSAKVGPAKAIKHILQSALTESGTEWAEEPTEAAILERLKKDPSWKPIMDAMVEGVNVIPVTMLLGGLGAGGSLMAQRGANTAQGEAPADPGAIPPGGGPAAPTGQPRPAFGSFEGTVLEFKVKQAMGLKPADHLTQEAISAAFAAGKIPQDLAEQMGHPGALQAAADEAAKNAPPAPALAPEEAVIQQVLADKTQVHAALTEPHPVTGQKPYEMSEAQYGAALREIDPNISGEEIARNYARLLGDAKDAQLVDDRAVAELTDPVLAAEANIAQATAEDSPVDFDLMDAGPASLSAMPLDELQAKFPGMGEQLHRELVVAGLNAGQITPEQSPYADIKKAAIERVNQEQANVEKRQEAAAGSKTPILQMAWKRKFNRAAFAKEGFDLGALRGYFTEKGGMTPELATENAYEMGWIPEYDQALFFEKLDAEMMRREGIIRSPEEPYSPEPTPPQRPAGEELPQASLPNAGPVSSPSARQAVLRQLQGRDLAYANSIKDEPRFVKGVENAALAYEAAAAELGMAPTAENWKVIDDKLHQSPKGVAAAMNEKYGTDAAAKAADPAYIQAARWTAWHFEMGKPLWAAKGKQAYDVFLPDVGVRSPIVDYNPAKGVIKEGDAFLGTSFKSPRTKYSPGHVYTPGELLTDEAGAGADTVTAVADTRRVRPVGQWHDLRNDPAIARIDKDFIEKQLTSAIGQRISTIQDVAEIAAMARHPRIEHLAVVKLKKGKVIGSLVLTDGKIGYIDPNMAVIQAFLQDADEFYMSHNHPTGDPTPSMDDVESTKKMATDKRFKGHVVTDHKTYTAISPDGVAIAQEYRGEKQSFRTDIEKMSTAPAIMGWVRGTLQGDKLGIMFVDPQKQVMSFDQVDPRSDYNTYITRKAAGYGATDVFLVAGDSAFKIMRPQALHGGYIDFLVIGPDGSYRSASLGNVEGFSIQRPDRDFADDFEGHFSATRFAETPADYNPEDYNKVLGRFKPGMALTLRNRLVTPQFPAGLPRGSVFELKSVAKTGEMLVSYKGKILTVAMTPNMFKETYREPGAPQPGQKERQFIDTVRGMEKTNKTVKDTIAGNYDVITNEVTLAEAKAIIAGSMDRAIKLVNETKEPTRLSNTVAMLLIDAMQQQGRFEEAIGLIEHTAERNTGAGQAIQALAMYRRLTPEGILRFADSVVRKAQDKLGALVNVLRGLANDEARAAFAKKHGIPYMSAQQASDLYDAAVAIAKMEPGRARDLATGKMLLKVAQLVPKTFWEKVSSLQILAQLLNPKTFVRNLIGNAAFMAFENFSQAAGVPLDMLVGTITGKRTIGMPGFMTQVSGFLKGAKEGGEEALAGIDLKQVNNKFDLPRGSAFDSRAMRALEALLNISLKATDRAFYQAAFEDSLRVAMKQAKVNAPTPEMVSQAHLDGLYRTFNDDNALRTALVHVKRSFNLNQKWGLGDMVIKYPGTPASILMRGIEYSPFGFMQAVYTLAKAGSVANFDQRAFVQQTTRALNGSLLLVGTGMILSALGLIRGKDDDKKGIRETEAAIGVRDYQINLSGLIRFAESGMDPAAAKMRKGDQLVSYDWMQPMAINLAMGANIQRGVETSGSAMIADALQSASMTLEEQPLLTGIARFFSGRSLTKGVEATIKAIPASFVPTLVNQFRQLIDNVSRNTQSNSYLDAMGNQVKMKVPGLSRDLPPRVDVLGRVRKTYQNDTNNPFNVFFNPAFVNRYEPTPTTELVLDIWARSGETIQLPRIAPRQIKVRGVTRPLTEMEQAQFQHYIGERTALAFSGLARNSDFLAAPDYEKAKHLQAILTDIYQSARVNVLGVPPR